MNVISRPALLPLLLPLPLPPAAPLLACRQAAQAKHDH
jgi:hypothetical protein